MPRIDHTGSAFAIPGFLRLSYAAHMTQLEQAKQRLVQFLEQSK